MINTFYGCTSLVKITSEIKKPFQISAFDSSSFDNATLFVPVGTIEAYKATYGWKNFKTIKEIGGTTITLSITDDNSIDVTENVNIVWYNSNGKQIGSGKVLNGVEYGMVYYFSILLDENLGRTYREIKMHKILANENSLSYQLEKIGRVMLEGRVSATGIENNTMIVNVRQMLNGKWEQTYQTQTDEQGVFSVEVSDDETDITISGEGYFDATLHRNGFGGNGNVGTINMSLITGFTVSANIKIHKTEGNITKWTDGLNNIEFTLINKTKDKEITDLTVQNGKLIIKTGANVGDVINLIAKSKQGVFADSSTTFTIVEGANSFDLQLNELGGIDATCAGSNNGSTTGYLYNSNGLLKAKGSYTGEMLNIRHIKSGVYTLVSMGSSVLLGSMTHLEDLAAIGLIEGNDYVSTHIEVIDGELTVVNVDEIPKLDETQFYYTSGNTYFNASKTSLIAGNYLTLQAHVDFKSEYADKVGDVTLTIDLPEGCQMMENSVIANCQAVAHTVNGSRITIPLSKEQWKDEVRFCVTPTRNLRHFITAMASFDIDGQLIQPIGTVCFDVKGPSLNVPKQSANTNIYVIGTAKRNSEISIYDNEVLIGKTFSKADGLWTMECELYKAGIYSFHNINEIIKTGFFTGMA